MLAVDVQEHLPVAAAREGEAGAWDVLFRRFQLPLYVYLFELVHHEQQALDLVQETFINAARHLHTLRDDAKFGSWLFGIAHQKWLQYARRAGRAAHLFEGPSEATADIPDQAEAPSAQLIRQEDEERFMNCIARLPPGQRAVLLLYFVEDFSLEAIAEVVGAPLGTVKSRLHYAKKTLHQLLRDSPL